MSKESRRAARLARESRRLGGASGAAGTPTDALGTATPGGAGTPPTRSNRPAGAPARAGRRDRARLAAKPTFFERYRSVIITVAAVAVVAVAVGFVFIGSTAASYTCGQQFAPSPTPPVDPSSSTRLGFPQDDMGQTHISGLPTRYLFCPPASGNHLNAQGQGPITPRLYKPDDKVGPPNWVHNLEHGGLVILYRNDSPGATAAGQQAFRTYFDNFPDSPVCKVPKGVISPVIARFDDMPHLYAAIVWDRVFYLDTWDPDLVNRFYLTESERLDVEGRLITPPEKLYCNPSPSPSVAPGESAPVASGSVAPASSAPSAAASAAPSSSPELSAAPS